MSDKEEKLLKNERPLDLLFMWVKQGHVTCKEFRTLLQFIDRHTPINTSDNYDF